MILFAGVASSWIGIPIVGGAAALSELLASSQANGKLDVWLAIATATAAAWTGGYVGYLLGIRGLGLPPVARRARPPAAGPAGGLKDARLHPYAAPRSQATLMTRSKPQDVSQTGSYDGTRSA